MFTPTSEAAFGKVGILCLRFRKTGRQIAALTLEQMCSLFYLKRATVGQGLMQMSSVGGADGEMLHRRVLGGGSSLLRQCGCVGCWGCRRGGRRCAKPAKELVELVCFVQAP